MSNLCLAIIPVALFGGVLLALIGMSRIFRKEAAALDKREEAITSNAKVVAGAIEAMIFAEHKIDQHLQGQYNEPPYPALGAALYSLRAALKEIEGAQI